MALRTTPRRLAGATVAVVTGLLCGPWAQTASAAAPDASSTARHCVVDARTGQQNCFGTFTEAVGNATGGRITDAPATPQAAAASKSFRTEAAEADAGAQGDVIQGTFFDEKGFTGASLTVTGPELCEKDGWVNWQFDLGDDWKNRISSVQPWGNCAIWLYPEPNLGGDRDGPFDENTDDVGQALNDRTQSIGFS
ncbi:conserved hypothetical protein [Streptomyces himastatinicus ATCC 53653]|uniref:Secreted protein n=1 Tax=Streptomyces himastatinicus ATCC 53653 TaxID=457427 RepID=D9WV30_9ACTN|nr:hypothetical protein [Streptomyces himastatinicus]EFL28530.1 conserved hypothetical protein [Streptomyces himastatinicus ATCC 53653]